jgi:nitrilase
MGDTYPRFTAAAVQAAPVFLDREATVDKACRLIGEAAAAGARLIVFPEAWIPTFPYWPRGTNPYEPHYQASLQAHVALLKNAVELPSATTRRLGEAAQQADAYVVIGISERDTRSGGTLYNTQLYLDRSGRILGRHRKLVPTGSERVVWAPGDGGDLRVYETNCGRIGGLICWENFMPLPRAALIAQGQQVHATHFPGGGTGNPDMDVRHASMPHVFCRYYAFEGQVFVINAMGLLSTDAVPDAFPLKPAMRRPAATGGSVIVGPSGKFLAGPVWDQETILFAEIDLAEILETKARIDTAGHYARWDIAQLQLTPRRHEPFVQAPVERASLDGPADRARGSSDPRLSGALAHPLDADPPAPTPPMSAALSAPC